LRFDLLFGVGDGVGDALFRFAEAVGDGVGVGFFVECFRCLRDGVGLGSASRTLLIFVPNDSSAEGAASTAPKKRARIRSHFISQRCSVRCPQRRFESGSPSGCAEDSARYSKRSRARAGVRVRTKIRQRALGGLLCSNGCRFRNFREENFR